jgi:hypothetical protein
MKPTALLSPKKCIHCGKIFGNFVSLSRHLSWCEKRNFVRYFIVEGRFLFIYIGAASKSALTYLDAQLRKPMSKDEKTNTAIALGAALTIHNNTIKSRFFQVFELTDSKIPEDNKNGLVRVGILEKLLSEKDKKELNKVIDRGFKEANAVQYKRYKSNGLVKRIMPEGSTSL